MAIKPPKKLSDISCVWLQKRPKDPIPNECATSQKKMNIVECSVEVLVMSALPNIACCFSSATHLLTDYAYFEVAVCGNYKK